MSKLHSALTIATFILLPSIVHSQSPLNLANLLTYRLESFNINLDPARIVDTQSRRVVDMLHAKLLSVGPEGKYKGELAQNWAWNGPNKLEIQLRNGLTFSNGKLVTAEDVVWSLCRLLQPSAPYRWLFSNVVHGGDANVVACTGLRASSDRSVEIDVSSDPERLLPALASSSAAIVPADSKSGEFGSIPGAGPYEVEEITSNSRITLKARMGGPIEPQSKHVVFQLVQDDSVAATLFKAGKLDVLEIANPTLFRLLVTKDGKLSVPGRLIGSDVQQIRLLIFNRMAIARALKITDSQAQEWIRSVPSHLDLNAMKRRFAPIAIPLTTSYFPARQVYARAEYHGPVPPVRGKLLIITENDPFSDAIAAQIPARLDGAEIDHVGLEKSILVSRLLKKDFEIASISLEAMMNSNAYWLSFFTPGSPFTVFGEPLAGLSDSSASDPNTLIAEAKEIDSRGNWLALFEERHYYAFQPGIGRETFLQTGLIDYATIGEQQ